MSLLKIACKTCSTEFNVFNYNDRYIKKLELDIVSLREDLKYCQLMCDRYDNRQKDLKGLYALTSSIEVLNDDLKYYVNQRLNEIIKLLKENNVTSLTE